MERIIICVVSVVVAMLMIYLCARFYDKYYVPRMKAMAAIAAEEDESSIVDARLDYFLEGGWHVTFYRGDVLCYGYIVNLPEGNRMKGDLVKAEILALDGIYFLRQAV